MVAKIEIVGADDVIALRDDAFDYLRSSGGSGWGKAPVANFRTEGAADGWKFRGQRVTGRTYVLPAIVFGDSVLEVNDRVRRLVRLVSGEFTLRFTNEQGTVFTIPAVYESGLEGIYELGNRTAGFSEFTVQCPDPFWTSAEPQVIEWAYAAGEPFLLNRKLTSGSLDGNRQAMNLGDVESRPSWRFDGPFESLSVAVNGEGFLFTESMLAGEFLQVQHDGWSWTVTDHAGVNRFAGVEWGARFPSLPPGESTVSLDLAGADAGTRVSVFFPERREVMF